MRMSELLYIIPVVDDVFVAIRQKDSAIHSVLVRKMSSGNETDHFRVLLPDIDRVVMQSSSDGSVAAGVVQGRSYFVVVASDGNEPIVRAVSEGSIQGDLMKPLDAAKLLSPTVSTPWKYTYLPKKFGVSDETVLLLCIIACALIVMVLARTRRRKGTPGGG